MKEIVKRLIQVLYLIPFEKLRKKIVHSLLDYVDEGSIRTKNGFKIFFSKRGIAKELRKQMVSGIYEQDEVSIYKKIVKTGDVVIDVGATGC